MTLALLTQRSLTMLRSFGPLAFCEFLALTMGTRALQIILSPEGFREDMLRTEIPSLMSIFLDPFVLIHEVLFTLVFAAACLRIWWSSNTAPEDRHGALTGPFLPLVTLNLLTGIALYMGLILALLPGLLIAAVTTTLTPVILFEGLGWRSLGRALRQSGRQIWRLTVVWGMILIPWLLMLSSVNTPPEELATADMSALWWAQFTPDVISAGLSVVVLCMTMSAYTILIEDEAGGSGSLMSIFR